MDTFVVGSATGGGSSGLTAVSKSTNYTAVDGDLVLVDATGGAITITLPLASTRARLAVIKVDSSANTVTVQRSGSDLIVASTSITLAKQNDGVQLAGDGGTHFYAY